MLAVFINCVAVVIGSLLGLVVGKKLSDNFKEVVFSCAGLVTFVMGVQMALETSNFLALFVSLILGGFVGYAIGIEDAVLKVGEKLQKSFSKNGSSNNFALGFMNASVLFCSGAMAIVGSIQAGTTGDMQTLLIKSAMDLCMAVVFSSVYGIGVMFSIFFILIYQGFFVLAGGWIEPVLGTAGITEISAAGGILLTMIGSGLLKVKQFKTANYLPALIFVPFLSALAAKIF